ncbi:MAG: ACT domain-containing protein [Castellaniella sp.]
MTLSFSVLPQSFVIARLEPDADIPNAVLTSGNFISITRTDEELSIVCVESAATDLVKVDQPWRAIKIHGPFAFDLTGILASFLNPLASAAIGIFATSTFDTDYILVKSENIERAVQALQAAGHNFVV